jgi:hypothetical protein
MSGTTSEQPLTIEAENFAEEKLCGILSGVFSLKADG